MAEALAAEEMVPCDSCHRQITLDDWTTHIVRENHFSVFDSTKIVRSSQMNCQVTRRSSEPEVTNALFSSETEDTATNLFQIPCEFCESLVPFDQFDQHTVKSSTQRFSSLDDRFRDGVPKRIDVETKSKSGESIDLNVRFDRRRSFRKAAESVQNLLLPCEFCELPFPAKLLETHSVNSSSIFFVEQFPFFRSEAMPFRRSRRGVIRFSMELTKFIVQSFLVSDRSTWGFPVNIVKN